MKLTHNLIAILALSSVTVAVAADNRWFAGKQRPAPQATTTVSQPMGMNSCDGLSCQDCSKGKASQVKAKAGGNRWFAGKYRPAA